MAKRKAGKSGPKRTGRSSQKTQRASSKKLSKEAVTLIVVLRARQGQEMLLEAELRALITPTRKEAGCIRYDLFRSTDAVGAFMFYEVWQNREAHTAHTKTDHFLRWNARKDALTLSREAGFWQQIA